MDMDDLVEQRRNRRTYIRKEDTEPVPAEDVDYEPLIERIAQDFGLEGDYIVTDDGEPVMSMLVDDCTKPCDKYDADIDGGWIHIRLDGMNKDCGSMGASTAGAVNARYSDKPKKSRRNPTATSEQSRKKITATKSKVKKDLPELGNTVADVWLDEWGYEEITARGSENGKQYYGVYLDDGGYEFDVEFEMEDIGDEMVQITTYLVDDGYNNELDVATFKYNDSQIRDYMISTVAGLWREINESLGKSKKSRRKSKSRKSKVKKSCDELESILEEDGWEYEIWKVRTVEYRTVIELYLYSTYSDEVIDRLDGILPNNFEITDAHPYDGNTFVELCCYD